MKRSSSRYLVLLALSLSLAVQAPAEQLFVRKAATQGYYVGRKAGAQLEMIEGVQAAGTLEVNGRLLYVWQGVESSRDYHTPLPPGAAPAGDPMQHDGVVDQFGAAFSNGMAALATMQVPVVDPETWGAAASQDGGRSLRRVVVLSSRKVVRSAADVQALDWGVHLDQDGIEDGFFWENARQWRIVEVANFEQLPTSWYFAEAPADQRRATSFFEYGWGRGSLYGDVNIRSAIAGDEFSKSLFGNGKTFALDLEVLSPAQREYVEAGWWGRFTARVGHGIDELLGDDEPVAEPTTGGSLLGQGE